MIASPFSGYASAKMVGIHSGVVCVDISFSTLRVLEQSSLAARGCAGPEASHSAVVPGGTTSLISLGNSQFLAAREAQTIARSKGMARMHSLTVSPPPQTTDQVYCPQVQAHAGSSVGSCYSQ